MDRIKLVKHVLTTLILLALIAGIFQIVSLDLESELFGPNLISGSYFLFVFVVLLVYRLNWVGIKKVDWFALLAALTTLGLLSIMLIAPKNILALWKVALTSFILLSSYVLLRKVTGKSVLSWVTRGLLLATCLTLLAALLMRITSPVFYTISWLMIMSAGLLALINLFVPGQSKN